MLWELSGEEFALFQSSEGRKSLFGGEYDIQLSVAERAYWYGKQMDFTLPTVKVLGFGKTIFNSKWFGYRSKWFGRYNKAHLPDGVKGNLNQGKVRVGWNAHNGHHVFRVAWGPPRTNHFDILRGPKW